MMPISPYISPLKERNGLASSSKLSSSFWSPSPVKSPTKSPIYETKTNMNAGIEKLVPRESLQILTTYLQKRNIELSKEYKKDLQTLAHAINSYTSTAYRNIKL